MPKLHRVSCGTLSRDYRAFLSCMCINHTLNTGVFGLVIRISAGMSTEVTGVRRSSAARARSVTALDTPAV